MALSLYARGLTAGEISAHFQEIYGADVSRETVSRITERVVAEKDEWCSLCFVKFLWAVSAFLLVRLSGCF